MHQTACVYYQNDKRLIFGVCDKDYHYPCPILSTAEEIAAAVIEPCIIISTYQSM